MAIAFDAFSESTPGTGNQTSSHGGGTPKAVLVFVATLGSTDEIGAVDYGGDTMTELALSPVAKGTGEAMTISGWFLGTSIPTGTQTVTAVASATTLSKKMFVITYSAATDCEVIDTSVINSDAAGVDPSVTVSLGGRTCAVAISFQSGHDNLASITPLSGWTERDETDAGTITLGTYTYDTVGTTDVTAGLTAADEDLVLVAVAFSEIVAGGDAVPVCWAQYRTRRL